MHALGSAQLAILAQHGLELEESKLERVFEEELWREFTQSIHNVFEQSLEKLMLPTKYAKNKYTVAIL